MAASAIIVEERSRRASGRMGERDRRLRLRARVDCRRLLRANDRGRAPAMHDDTDCPSGFYCPTSCRALLSPNARRTGAGADVHRRRHSGGVDAGTGGGSGEGTGGCSLGGTGGEGGRTGTGGGSVVGGGGAAGAAGVSGSGGAMVGSGGHGGTIAGGSGGTPGGAGGMSGTAGGMGTAGHVGTGGTTGTAGRTGSGGAMMGTGGTTGVGGKTGNRRRDDGGGWRDDGDGWRARFRDRFDLLYGDAVHVRLLRRWVLLQRRLRRTVSACDISPRNLLASRVGTAARRTRSLRRHRRMRWRSAGSSPWRPPHACSLRGLRAVGLRPAREAR